MRTNRYDIEAGRNVLTMLQRVSPGDYAVLMTKLKTQAGMAGLGQNGTEEQTTGFWSRIFEYGGQALTTIADYKLTEQRAGLEAQARQKAYDEAVVAEMERQAMLANQARTAAMEYQNQVEFARQKAALDAAATSAKTKFNWALIAAGGLGLLLANVRA